MSFNNNLKYGFSDNNPTCMTFSDKNISGEIIEKDINNEIYVIKSSLQLEQDMSIKSSSNIDGIILSYSLHGYMEHKGVDSNNNLKVNTNDSIMCIVKEERGVTSIPKGTFNRINFIIKKEFIEKNINDNKILDYILNPLDKEFCQKRVFQRKTTDYINLILHDLYQLNFEEGLNNIYLQSKILELFFLELSTITDTDKKLTSKKALKLDDYDIEAIKRAKEILLQNLQNPPSIIELARRVAINDFKLKKGFKEVFNTTPYNFLLDYKLKLATKLLNEGEMNVNEIAQFTGYKHTSNFSKAFKKKYGILPKDLMKTKDYYY